jgi:rubredoxin
MSEVANESVKCDDCGYVFQGDDLDQDSGKRKPCPKCGSLKRQIFLSIKETLELSEYIGIKARNPSIKHKKNRPDYESEQGVTRGKNGKRVYKRKVIDREHPDSPGSYTEYVRDKDGNIIVNKSEKLSAHRG